MDDLVGCSLACILPCSSISLPPTNLLTLCLKISINLSPVSRSLCCTFSCQQLHQQVESCTSRGYGSIGPRRFPHFPLKGKSHIMYFQGPCFKLPWDVSLCDRSWGKLFIVIQHAALLNQQHKEWGHRTLAQSCCRQPNYNIQEMLCELCVHPAFHFLLYRNCEMH